MGELRAGPGLEPPDLGVHEEHCSFSLYQTSAASPSESPCLLPQACSASPIRQILFPQGSTMTPLPNGLYQACPDSKDQEQRGLDRQMGAQSVETPGAEGPSPRRSCREQDKARQQCTLTASTGGQGQAHLEPGPRW